MKKVCVVQREDGSLAVGIEPAREEMAEGGMPDEAMGGEMDMEPPEDDLSYLEPAGDLEEALQMVRVLLAQEENPEADSAFGDGFGRVSGTEELDTKGMR